MPASVSVELPPWCEPFSAPSRYKVAYGGRGSGKSWAFARLLVLAMIQHPLRVLCARELQISIRDSVHRLISDQIEVMGLTGHFEIGESFLRCRNGGEILFKGLRHNAGEIKSMENIGLCWVEEAQGVSDSSWALLIPTIRAPGSEIWITFNPDQETDPTYKRFVVDPPPDALVRQVNWVDNPWFPPELQAEKDYLARVDPDSYAHVWEGACRNISDAQVLRGKVSIEAFEPQPEWDGPYFGADWGFAQDPTALVKMWVNCRRLFVEHEAYGVGVEIDHLPAMFDRLPGSRERVIRADSARPETISYMQRQKFNIIAASKWSGSVEDGIAFLRGFEQIVVHPRCKHVIEETRLYRYKTDRLTGDVLPALVDANNHAIDAIRYALSPLIQARTQVSPMAKIPML